MMNSIPSPADKVARAEARAAASGFTMPHFEKEMQLQLVPYGCEGSLSGDGYGAGYVGLMLSLVYVPRRVAIISLATYAENDNTTFPRVWDGGPGAGGSVRLGIYDTEDGLPRNRLWQSPEMGYAEMLGTRMLLAEVSPQIILEPGWYWLALRRALGAGGQGHTYRNYSSTAVLPNDFGIANSQRRWPVMLCHREAWIRDESGWWDGPEPDDSTTTMAAVLDWPSGSADWQEGDSYNYLAGAVPPVIWASIAEVSE